MYKQFVKYPTKKQNQIKRNANELKVVFCISCSRGDATVCMMSVNNQPLKQSISTLLSASVHPYQWRQEALEGNVRSSHGWRRVKAWSPTWSLSCRMFFSMCGSRPLKVNSWMNCLMWSWSFRVRHAPWLPAPPARLSGSLAPFFSSGFTSLRVCRLPELLAASNWRGWLSGLLAGSSGWKRGRN